MRSNYFLFITNIIFFFLITSCTINQSLNEKENFIIQESQKGASFINNYSEEESKFANTIIPTEGNIELNKEKRKNHYKKKLEKFILKS